MRAIVIVFVMSILTVLDAQLTTYTVLCDRPCQCCDFNQNIECQCRNVCPTQCVCRSDETMGINQVNCHHLESSEISQLPASATDLVITHSNFGVLRTYAIDAKRKLRTLDLRSNNISMIEPRAMLVLDMLQHLDLRDNNLASIDMLTGSECANCSSLYSVQLTIDHENYLCNHLMDAQSLTSDRFASMLEQLRTFIRRESVIINNPWRCFTIRSGNEMLSTQKWDGNNVMFVLVGLSMLIIGILGAVIAMYFIDRKRNLRRHNHEFINLNK